MIRVIPAKLTHVGPIASRMRADDIAECRAHGHSPKDALRIGLRGSVDALTALVDGRPEAMMGLVPENVLEGRGRPWMLGTDAVYRNPRALLALGPRIIAMWRDSTPTLVNLVWRENARAICMLRRWGFEIGEQVTDMGGLAFVEFRMGARESV